MQGGLGHADERFHRVKRANERCHKLDGRTGYTNLPSQGFDKYLHFCSRTLTAQQDVELVNTFIL